MPERRFRDMRLTEDEVSAKIEKYRRRTNRRIFKYPHALFHIYLNSGETRAKRLLPLWRDWGLRNLSAESANESLQSQLAWTPVSEGLPTEPGTYELEFRTTAKYQLKMYEDGQSFSWMLRDRPLASHATEFDEFRRIDLPEATHGCDCDTPTTVHDVACPMNRGES